MKGFPKRDSWRDKVSAAAHLSPPACEDRAGTDKAHTAQSLICLVHLNTHRADRGRAPTRPPSVERGFEAEGAPGCLKLLSDLIKPLKLNVSSKLKQASAGIP